MTQEDLLALLDHPATYFQSILYQAALRSIVELHKPMEDSPYCEHCCRMAIEFPCPTFQAIEEALK